jgi:hypothetical protein
MTTAREQADVAVSEKMHWMGSSVTDSPHWRMIGGDTPKSAADAASDVWEPLLREAYTQIERSTPRPGEQCDQDRILKKIKEALGV